MEVGFKTDKGMRRSNNEDACFVMKKDRVFIVADGVGGTIPVKLPAEPASMKSQDMWKHIRWTGFLQQKK